MRNMAKIAYVLACLAYASQGRRVQSAVRRLQGSPVADGDDGLYQSSSSAGTASQTVATLLMALERAAFNPSLQGRAGSPPRARPTSLRPNGHRQLPQRARPDPRMFFSFMPKVVDQKVVSESKVEQYIASFPMIMFSKRGCPFCAQAKEAFNEIGHPISVLELDKLPEEQADAMQDHLQTLTGARTVPRVFVGHKFIGGGTDVARLAETGELTTLVEQAKTAHQDDLSGKDISLLSKSDDEWRKELDPQIYRILRKRGTEMPGSHEYDQFYPEKGHFACAGCGLPLYSASSKFKSNCGWPVFDKCYHSEEMGCHVGTRPDGSGSLEIVCPKCSGHLGHVFFDSFSEENPNGERH
mmetsp:Transcript_133928/g.250551  ORF Transcript_133928/g.250551 Transcript_133928/m.250551 type:complete len:355 (+) Transcript_133928:65-1129(+)